MFRRGDEYIKSTYTCIGGRGSTQIETIAYKERGRGLILAIFVRTYYIYDSTVTADTK